MPRATTDIIDKNVTFWVGLEPGDEDDLEMFDLDIDATYEVTSDDPAYDPNSGNSLTMTWHPETSVELQEVGFSFNSLRKSLEPLLDKFGLAGKEITLAFSYEGSDPWVKNKDGKWEDTRPTAKLDTLRIHEDKYPDDWCIAVTSDIYEYLEPMTDSIVVDEL